MMERKRGYLTTGMRDAKGLTKKPSYGELLDKITALEQQLQALQAENERLSGVLRFYADTNNITTDGGYVDHDRGLSGEWDNGNRAKQALSGKGEG